MFRLTEMIDGWYSSNQFGLIFIYGKSGFGKSVYAWKILDELNEEEKEIKHSAGWDPYLDGGKPLWTQKGPLYNDVRKYLIFQPRELLAFSQYMRLNKLRWKAILIDDAGLWFKGTRSYDPVLDACIQWLMVARSVVSCVMMTTPALAALAGGIKNQDAYTVKVRPEHYSRAATGYAQALVGKYTNIRKVWKDYFAWKLRDDLYNWYSRVRASYVHLAENKLESAIKKQEAKNG